MKLRKNVIAIIILIMVSIFLFYNSFREKISEYRIECSLINKRKIVIILTIDQRKLWYKFPKTPVAHGAYDFKIGGGDKRQSLEFKYNEKIILFNTRGNVSVFNIWNEKIYLITSENDRINHFKFYRYINKWEEIKAEVFPKEIAIENFCIGPGTGYEIDPESKTFRAETTSFIWKRLGEDENDFNEWEKINVSVEKDYLCEYKKRYIDPYWSLEKLRERNPRVLSATSKSESFGDAH